MASIHQAERNFMAPYYSNAGLPACDNFLTRNTQLSGTLAAIRQGMEEFKHGKGIPLKKAEAKLRRKHGFSR